MLFRSVINLQIRDYDLYEHYVSMPTDADGEVMGCIDEKYRGMDAHQVFLLLEKEQEQGGGGKGQPTDGKGNQQGGGQGQTLDDHDWDGAGEIPADKQEQIAREIEGALRQGSILVGKMGGNVNRNINDLLTPKINWKDALRDFVKTEIGRAHV